MLFYVNLLLIIVIVFVVLVGMLVNYVWVFVKVNEFCVGKLI